MRALNRTHRDVVQDLYAALLHAMDQEDADRTARGGRAFAIQARSHGARAADVSPVGLVGVSAKAGE